MGPILYLFKLLSPAVWQQIALVLALINAINFEDTVSPAAVQLCHMKEFIIEFAFSGDKLVLKEIE